MPETALPAGELFERALTAHAPRYQLELRAQETKALRDYYELVQAWNPRLHLVAPCAPEEFATRHVLESLQASVFIPEGASLCDIGSGAGLPGIPCLIARPDIARATFIEASPKKAVFLREALSLTGFREKTRVVAARFEQTPAPEASVITCRALDRFTALFPNIHEWSPKGARLILFGGPTLEEEIRKAGLSYSKALLPETEQRYLFVIDETGAFTEN